MILPPAHIVPVNGRFWRAGFTGREDQLLAPASAPNGRWHHGGQRALYLSGTAEGCQVALRVYVRPDDPERTIHPFHVQATRIADLRNPVTRDLLQVTLTDIHAFWADLLAEGSLSPTWTLADRLRDSGLDGLLTPSRSRPDLTHLTLFRWNCPEGPTVEGAGAPQPFNPHYPLGKARAGH